MPIFKFKQILFELATKFYDARCFRQAGALAYTTLLAIVPVLTMVFFILTLFPISQNLTQVIENVIFTNFVTSSAQNVQKYLHIFIGQAQHLPILGILTLIVTAALLIISTERAFNDIWQVPKSRHGMIAFFMYMTELVLLTILTGMAFIASSYLTRLPIIEASIIKKMLFSSIPNLATFTAFALLYAFLPNCKVSFRAAAIGSLVATILFELAKHGFSVYITIFANYKLIYGALSLIPIFLVWLYVFWVILLFGVVVSYVITKKNKIN